MNSAGPGVALILHALTYNDLQPLVALRLSADRWIAKGSRCFAVAADARSFRRPLLLHALCLQSSWCCCSRSLAVAKPSRLIYTVQKLNNQQADCTWKFISEDDLRKTIPARPKSPDKAMFWDAAWQGAAPAANNAPSPLRGPVILTD